MSRPQSVSSRVSGRASFAKGSLSKQSGSVSSRRGGSVSSRKGVGSVSSRRGGSMARNASVADDSAAVPASKVKQEQQALRKNKVMKSGF